MTHTLEPPTTVPGRLDSLRQRLWQHPFGEGATRGLPERIARENGWSGRRVARALEEYRRFCLLAVLHDGDVSPSDDVDVVWHAHLLYTKDYWELFCPEILQMRLHHVPNPGTDGDRLAECRRRTLTRYRETFGEEPPPDVWAPGHARKRFVDGRTHWVIPKVPRKLVVLVITALLAAVAVMSIGAGAVIEPAGPGAVGVPGAVATSAERGATAPVTAGSGFPVVGQAVGLGPLDMRGPEFLGFYAGAFALALGAGLVCRWQARRATRVVPHGLLPEPYELAMLRRGGGLAVTAAVAALAYRGAVRTSGDSLLPGDTGPGRSPHPLEAAVYRAVKSGATTLQGVIRAVRPELAELRGGLVDAGLVPETGRETMLRTLALLVTLSVPALGLMKVAVGLARDRPVGYLAVAVTVTAGMSLLLFARQTLRTRDGDRVLAELSRKIDPVEAQAEAKLRVLGLSGRAVPIGPDGMPTARAATTPLASAGIDPLVLSIALYGTSVLQGTRLESVRRATAGSEGGGSMGAGSDGGSSDSSPSDTGGGDGGGCGGCGGGGGD